MTDEGPIRFVSDREHYGFMSNFYSVEFTYRGRQYKTAEHAFQEAKTNDASWRRRIREAATPKEAKRLGRQCPMDAQWDHHKISVMRDIVLAKFQSNPKLAAKLVATEKRLLEEDAPWDSFWGTGRDGTGRNELGRVLMVVRRELMSDTWKGEATVVRQANAAVLVDYEGEEQWIPYSQIHDDSELWEQSDEGETGMLAIPLWLAEKKGWA